MIKEVKELFTKEDDLWYAKSAKKAIYWKP